MTPATPSKCPICQKRFWLKENFERHVCDPVFWIIPQTSDNWDAWAEPVSCRGLGAESALIDWITQYEADDTEYPIASGTVTPKFRVFTTQQYEEAMEEALAATDINWLQVPGEVYEVSGEFLPSYSTNRCEDDEVIEGEDEDPDDEWDGSPDDEDS